MSVRERLPRMNMESTSMVEQDRNGVAEAMPVLTAVCQTECSGCIPAASVHVMRGVEFEI